MQSEGHPCNSIWHHSAVQEENLPPEMLLAVYLKQRWLSTDLAWHNELWT